MEGLSVSVELEKDHIDTRRRTTRELAEEVLEMLST